MSDLSTALKEAYARAGTSTRHLIALELIHASFPGGKIAFVNYDNDLSVGGVLHTGMAMEVREPEVGTEPSNKVKVRIDNAAGVLQGYINTAVQSGTAVTANLRPFAFNMQSKSVIDVVGTFPFQLLQAQYDMTATVLSLGHMSPTNQTFPGKRYTPDKYPALFR